MFLLNQLSRAPLVLPPTCPSLCWAFCISLGVTPRRTCCPSCPCFCPVPALRAALGWWWLLAFVQEHFTPLCPSQSPQCHLCSGWLEGPAGTCWPAWAGGSRRVTSAGTGSATSVSLTWLLSPSVSVLPFLVHPPTDPVCAEMSQPMAGSCLLCRMCRVP